MGARRIQRIEPSILPSCKTSFTDLVSHPLRIFIISAIPSKGFYCDKRSLLVSCLPISVPVRKHKHSSLESQLLRVSVFVLQLILLIDLFVNNYRTRIENLLSD